MNNDLSPLLAYITSCRAQGIPDPNIHSQALQSGWPQAYVDDAFRRLNVGVPQVAPKRNVKAGVLWILSPFIVLLSITVLQFLFRFSGLSTPILNIISLLGGMIGVVLFFVGPIVGIIKLTRH